MIRPVLMTSPQKYGLFRIMKSTAMTIRASLQLKFMWWCLFSPRRRSRSGRHTKRDGQEESPPGKEVFPSSSGAKKISFRLGLDINCLFQIYRYTCIFKMHQKPQFSEYCLGVLTTSCFFKVDII